MSLVGVVALTAAPPAALPIDDVQDHLGDVAETTARRGRGAGWLSHQETLAVPGNGVSEVSGSVMCAVREVRIARKPKTGRRTPRLNRRSGYSDLHRLHPVTNKVQFLSARPALGVKLIDFIPNLGVS
jgi:hypothetical protein